MVMETSTPSISGFFSIFSPTLLLASCASSLCHQPLLLCVPLPPLCGKEHLGEAKIKTERENQRPLSPSPPFLSPLPSQPLPLSPSPLSRVSRAESSEFILSTQRNSFPLFPFPPYYVFLIQFYFLKTGEKSELGWGEVTHVSTKVQNCR